jgi:hypothetical protein
MEGIAALGNDYPDPDFAFLKTIIVAHLGAGIDPVGKLGHRGSHPTVGVVEDALEIARPVGRAEILCELHHLFGADLGRTQHRLQVAIEQIGAAAVQQQKLP